MHARITNVPLSVAGGRIAKISCTYPVMNLPGKCRDCWAGTQQCWWVVPVAVRTVCFLGREAAQIVCTYLEKLMQDKCMLGSQMCHWALREAELTKFLALILSWINQVSAEIAGQVRNDAHGNKKRCKQGQVVDYQQQPPWDIKRGRSQIGPTSWMSYIANLR